MSWVSQANIKNIMTAIRNKFTTGDLVIANDAKDTGVELNYASQDGLVTVSPISTSASTEAALHLSNGDDTKKTELTQGTLSYVTGSGDSETYNYMSLLGDGVTFGKNGGGNVQLGGVADPNSAQQVATKNYVDNRLTYWTHSYALASDVLIDQNKSAIINLTAPVTIRVGSNQTLLGVYGFINFNNNYCILTPALTRTTDSDNLTCVFKAENISPTGSIRLLAGSSIVVVWLLLNR